MDSSAFLAAPFGWFFIAGVFLGAAASRATRRITASNDPERSKSKKWSLVSLFLFFSVVLAVAGGFIPGAEKVQDIRILYISGCAVFLSFLMLRFRKAVGLPLALVMVVVAILMVLFSQALISFSGETKIAQIRVLSAHELRMKLEVDVPYRQPYFFELNGEYFVPIVKVINFDELYFFPVRKNWYRFEGVASFRAEKAGESVQHKQNEGGHYFPTPDGISTTLYGFFERHQQLIPGINTALAKFNLEEVAETLGQSTGENQRLLEAFSILIRPDSSAQIVSAD